MNATTTRAGFLERLERGDVLIADGATGTTCQRMGLPIGVAPEEWVFTDPERIVALHRGFAEAGSDIVLTCTFGGTGIRLADGPFADRAPELNRRAAELAREGVGRDVLVAGSLGPTGQLCEPLGTLTHDEAAAAYAEQAEALVEGGVDLLVLETMFCQIEAGAAIDGVRRVDRPAVRARLLVRPRHAHDDGHDDRGGRRPRRGAGRGRRRRQLRHEPGGHVGDRGRAQQRGRGPAPVGEAERRPAADDGRLGGLRRQPRRPRAGRAALRRRPARASWAAAAGRRTSTCGRSPRRSGARNRAGEGGLRLLAEEHEAHELDPGQIRQGGARRRNRDPVRPARRDSRRSPSRSPGTRPCGSRAPRRPRASADGTRPAAPALRARRPARQGRRCARRARAGSRPAAVAFASPVRHPPSRRHSSRMAGPPARWMAPSTPPPPSSDSLAAFTIASTTCSVMSPRTISMPPAIAPSA